MNDILWNDNNDIPWNCNISVRRIFIYISFTCYLYRAILTQKNITGFQIPVRRKKKKMENELWNTDIILH